MLTQVNAKIKIKKCDTNKKESQNFQFYQFKIYGFGRVMAKKQSFKDAFINISIKQLLQFHYNEKYTLTYPEGFHSSHTPWVMEEGGLRRFI